MSSLETVFADVTGDGAAPEVCVVADHICHANSPSDNGGEYANLVEEIRAVGDDEVRPFLFELLRQRTIMGPR